LGFVTGGEFLVCLEDYQLFRKDAATWSQFVIGENYFVDIRSGHRRRIILERLLQKEVESIGMHCTSSEYDSAEGSGGGGGDDDDDSDDVHQCSITHGIS
jgi:hypothetical protein